MKEAALSRMRAKRRQSAKTTESLRGQFQLKFTSLRTEFSCAKIERRQPTTIARIGNGKFQLKGCALCTRRRGPGRWNAAPELARGRKLESGDRPENRRRRPQHRHAEKGVAVRSGPTLHFVLKAVRYAERQRRRYVIIEYRMPRIVGNMC